MNNLMWFIAFKLKGTLSIEPFHSREGMVQRVMELKGMDAEIVCVWTEPYTG